MSDLTGDSGGGGGCGCDDRGNRDNLPGLVIGVVVVARRVTARERLLLAADVVVGVERRRGRFGVLAQVRARQHEQLV